MLPLINIQVPPNYVICMQGGVHDILSTYDTESEAFFIGGKQLTIAATECDIAITKIAFIEALIAP